MNIFMLDRLCTARYSHSMNDKKRKKKIPRNPNLMAKSITDEATGEVPQDIPNRFPPKSQIVTGTKIRGTSLANEMLKEI